MKTVSLAAIASASVCAGLAMLACGGGSGSARGHDAPCSDSFGFLDFRNADSFSAAVSELELRLGDAFPASEPPDWATNFAVARGTLLVPVADEAGNLRNTESTYKFGWLRYMATVPGSPSVMVGTREIPFCDSQLVVFETGSVRTDAGRVDVLTLAVGGDDGQASTTALFQVGGEWMLVNIKWDVDPGTAAREQEVEAWITAVVEEAG